MSRSHLFTVVLAMALSLVVSNRSFAGVNKYYAALAVKVGTGEVLFDYQSNKRIYPASITKLMTLYLAFQAIEDGRLSLNDKVTISPIAAGQPAGKLGLQSGSTIRVRDLIMGIALVSANDATVALAEEIGGSVRGFVDLMNREALSLQMNDTHFENPTGIFHKDHYSTPRDVIIMSLILKKRFPSYYRIFSQPMFFLHGVAHYNTNTIVRYFKNIDGLNAGYTDISGYNSVCSFTYQDCDIVSAVFGFDNSMERDIYMKRLMEYSVKRVLHKASPDQKVIGASLFDDFMHENERVQPFLQRPVSFGAMSFNIIKRLLVGSKVRSKESLEVQDVEQQRAWARFAAVLHPIPRIRRS